MVAFCCRDDNGSADVSSLQFEWRIEPQRLAICKFADGRPWSLGSGGYVMVFRAVLDGVHDCAVKFLRSPDTSNTNHCDREDLHQRFQSCTASPHPCHYVGLGHGRSLCQHDLSRMTALIAEVAEVYSGNLIYLKLLHVAPPDVSCMQRCFCTSKHTCLTGQH